METRSKSVTSEEARQLNRAVRARKGRGLESGEARAAPVKDRGQRGGSAQERAAHRGRTGRRKRPGR